MVEHEAVALEGREAVELVEHRVVDVGQRDEVATGPQEPVPALTHERIADREQRHAPGGRRVGALRDLEERLVDQLVGVLRVEDRGEPAEVVEVLGVQLDEVEPHLLERIVLVGPEAAAGLVTGGGLADIERRRDGLLVRRSAVFRDESHEVDIGVSLRHAQRV